MSTREVPCRTSAETERQTPRRVRLSTSDRTPERTHRVGGASEQDPRESGQRPPGQTTSEAECAARVGQGRDAEQHVENKQRSAHSPENRADPQGQSRTKERGREKTQQTPEISLTLLTNAKLVPASSSSQSRVVAS